MWYNTTFKYYQSFDIIGTLQFIEIAIKGEGKSSGGGVGVVFFHWWWGYTTYLFALLVSLYILQKTLCLHAL